MSPSRRRVHGEDEADGPQYHPPVPAPRPPATRRPLGRAPDGLQLSRAGPAASTGRGAPFGQRLGEDLREAPCRRASTIPGSLAAVPPLLVPVIACIFQSTPDRQCQMGRRRRTPWHARRPLRPRPGPPTWRRGRGGWSLVAKQDLQAYRRRLEAELAELRGQRAELEEAAEASLPRPLARSASTSSPTPAASPSSGSVTCRWSTTPRT